MVPGAVTYAARATHIAVDKGDGEANAVLRRRVEVVGFQIRITGTAKVIPMHWVDHVAQDVHRRGELQVTALRLRAGVVRLSGMRGEGG